MYSSCISKVERVTLASETNSTPFLSIMLVIIFNFCSLILLENPLKKVGTESFHLDLF